MDDDREAVAAGAKGVGVRLLLRKETLSNEDNASTSRNSLWRFCFSGDGGAVPLVVDCAVDKASAVVDSLVRLANSAGADTARPNQNNDRVPPFSSDKSLAERFAWATSSAGDCGTAVELGAIVLSSKADEATARFVKTATNTVLGNLQLDLLVLTEPSIVGRLFMQATSNPLVVSSSLTQRQLSNE